MLQKKTNSYDELSTYSLVFHCCLNLDKIVERNKKMGSTSLGFFRTNWQNIGWYPTTEWFQNWYSQPFSIMSVCSQNVSGPLVRAPPDMFTSGQTPPLGTSTAQTPEMFKLVHYAAHTSVGKRVVGNRMKCFLINKLFFTWRRMLRRTSLESYTIKSRRIYRRH